MKRSSLVLSLLAGLSLLAAGLLLLWPTASLPRAPLRGVPRQLQGLVRIRLARVIASRAWREIVVERGEARGIERVTQTCGFNPLAGLDEVLVFALPRGGRSDLAVSARGALDHAKLLACVAKYSGGSMSAFVHERIAGFDTVRSKQGGERAAFVGRDGLVVGSVEAVSATLRTLAEQSASAEQDPLLRELYAALPADSDIALLARVPTDAKQRAALAEKLRLPHGFPLTDLRAITAHVRLVEDRVRGELRLWTPSPELARALAQRIQEARAQVLSLPGLGLLGFSKPARALHIENVGRDVKVRGEIQARTVNLAIDVLPALAALQRGSQSAMPAASNAPDAGGSAASDAAAH